LLQIPNEVWDDLRGGNYALLPAKALERLIDAELLVPNNSNERLTLTNTSSLSSTNVRTLTRMILPTAYCQLGCFYCGQEHAQKTMSPETMAALVADIRSSLSKGRFDRLLVTWFGGEPTTAPEVVRDLTVQFLGICKELDVRYESRMITNGVALTLPLTRMLVENCRVTVFTISLDGPERIHDARRATKTGKGTFARILRNLQKIVAAADLAECSIHIRVNIDNDNAPNIHEFIEILADLQLAKRVDVDLAVVVPWALHSSPQFIERPNFAEMEIGWFGHLLSRGFRVNLLPTPRASACLAAEPSSAVVATDGVLHNCALTPLALHEITRTTQPLGHLNSNDPKAGSDRHDEVFKLISSPEIPCYSCKYLFLCQGSCPKDIEKGLLNCPGYKFNLPARMSLHYLMKSQLNRAEDSEATFDFSKSQLNPEQEALVKQTITLQIKRFCSRFAMFRPPGEIICHGANSEADFRTAEEVNGRTRWHHRLQSVETPEAAMTADLAECYLAQLNPALYQLYYAGDNAEAHLVVLGFVSWASTLIIDGYEATTYCGPQRMQVALSRVGRHACLEHFLAQPVDRVLRLLNDIAAEKDSVPMASPAFVVPLLEVYN